MIQAQKGVVLLLFRLPGRIGENEGEETVPTEGRPGDRPLTAMVA